MEPPRGYVEPDPETFRAVAGLFDAAADFVESNDSFMQGSVPKYSWSKEEEPLRQGILKRAAETAGKARLFAGMAEKQMKGIPLTPSEHEEILYVGRIAEHHYLIYKSLANREMALSDPDPMPKVVEIGKGLSEYRMAAVGRPVEWDQIVAHFGRRQIVKGVSYSFYEFTSPELMDDSEWLEKLPSASRLSWISKFFSSHKTSCPPREPF